MLGLLKDYAAEQAHKVDDEGTRQAALIRLREHDPQTAVA
jgi:hypothetical protein